MKFNTLWIQLVSVLLLALVPFSASAFNCNEESPTFKKQGDKYFNLYEVKPLTKKQKENVQRIFSSLKKRLKGKGIVTNCEDYDGKIVKTVFKEKVTAEIDFQQGGPLSIQLEIYDKELKSTSFESLSYFNKNDNFKLIKHSRKSITLGYKIRTTGRRRATGALNEKIITLSVNSGALTISTLNFYNGYFTSSIIRTLRP